MTTPYLKGETGMPRGKATTKKAEVAPEVVTEDVMPKVETKREFQPFDLIQCESLVSGKLFYTSPKSNQTYEWANNGDSVDVTYEDLLAMKQSHSQILYRPSIMIKDADLLAQPRWMDIAKLYNSYDILSLRDAEKIINLDANSLRKALEKLNPAMRIVICDTAADMIEKGTLDSIQKIKVLDEVCGTELYTLAFK